MLKKKVSKLIVIIICILATGCSITGSKEDNQARHLKVMYYSEEFFYKDYGDTFQAKYPNTEIEVIETQNLDFESNKDTLKITMDKSKPDIVFLNLNQYEQYGNDGMLMDLTALIQKDHYDIENMNPLIIEVLKEKGSGKLYGLSPLFYANVLFYNIDLFKKYSIEPPHDNMTWEEVLKLAQLFPVESNNVDRIYGFGTSLTGNIVGLAHRIAYTEGINSINTNTMKVNYTSESWKRIWNITLNSFNSGAIYLTDEMNSIESIEDYYRSNPFLMEKVAMMFDNTNLLQDFQDATKKLKDFKQFKLGIAASPVDPLNRESSGDTELSEIFSIPTDAPNKDVAWDFIKYINGKDFAKIKFRLLDGNLPTRNDAMVSYGGMDLKAFYALRPKLVNYDMLNRIPEGLESQFKEMELPEIQRVMKKQITLDEALKKIQLEAQFMLEQQLKK